MGAHVSPVDIEGDTPLHNAAYRGWQRISNLLVQVGMSCVRARSCLYHAFLCYFMPVSVASVSARQAAWHSTSRAPKRCGGRIEDAC
jgi:hypothetical protein